MSEKILVAISGGVDSAVAAALLKKEGHLLTAVTMKICDCKASSDLSPKHHGCYGMDKSGEIADACRVAEYLEIPRHVLDLCREFEKEDLSGCVSGYRQGLTPNPCIYCNPRVKFGALVEAAGRAGLDFQKIATGHYARTEYQEGSGRYLLKKGIDPRKDQSYFLSFLNQQQLGMAVFPLGGYTKTKVREIAREMYLPVAPDRPESQDFTAGDYQDLLPDSTPGPIVDAYGRKLGLHSGISRYTVGQHKGMNLPGQEKLYVIKIIPEENMLVVGTEAELLRKGFMAGNLNWIAVEALSSTTEAEVKIRSGAKPAKALLEPHGALVRVIFDAPQKGIAPGQAAVFYKGDVMLGAGIINREP
jgi:tRNA-specific 2-thiouridylase